MKTSKFQYKTAFGNADFALYHHVKLQRKTILAWENFTDAVSIKSDLYSYMYTVHPCITLFKHKGK